MAQDIRDMLKDFEPKEPKLSKGHETRFEDKLSEQESWRLENTRSKATSATQDILISGFSSIFPSFHVLFVFSVRLHFAWVQILEHECRKKSIKVHLFLFSLFKIRRAPTRLPATGKKGRNWCCSHHLTVMIFPFLEACKNLQQKVFEDVYV